MRIAKSTHHQVTVFMSSSTNSLLEAIYCQSVWCREIWYCHWLL